MPLSKRAHLLVGIRAVIIVIIIIIAVVVI